MFISGIIIGTFTLILLLGGALRPIRRWAKPQRKRLAWASLMPLALSPAIVAPSQPQVAQASSLGAQIVSIVQGQVGYADSPRGTTKYCNMYSAYWGDGKSDCGNSNHDIEWCADFAAWVWAQVGITGWPL